jgi:hypothetical protein
MKLTNHEWMRAGVWMGLLLLVVCLMEMDREAHAQAISTTTVQGTVYLANGQPGTGTLVVSWPSFTTASGQWVAADSTTVAIAPDGFVSVNLAPNQGATPAGQYYTAVFYLSDGTTNTGYWVVPAVAEAALGQVQAQLMPSAQAVQAVSKAYVDQAIAGVTESLLTASGGTLSGPLTLSGDPTQPLQAADKHYVDETFGLAAPLTGAAFSGAVSAPSLSAKNSASIGPRYDVTQYGAVGNGSTDDTAAIQAAFNACYNGGVAPYGGVVEFPGNKTYVVSSTINAHNSCQVEGVVGNYTVANAPPKLAWKGAAAGTVSTITAYSIASGVATFTAANSLTVGQYVDIEGLATGTTLNRLIAPVATASSSQFTVTVPYPVANAGTTSDSGTATTANVMLAFDSNARYEQSVSNMELVLASGAAANALQVGIYYATRVDTGTRIINTWSQSATMYGYYFADGGINAEFDKGWRCDQVGIACIYWRVSGGDSFGIANGTVDNGQSGGTMTASGSAVVLDNASCAADSGVHFTARNFHMEVNSTIISGKGVFTMYDCPSTDGIQDFWLDFENLWVSSAASTTAGFNFTSFAMLPANDNALNLTIANAWLPSGTSPNTTTRWVGLPELLRNDMYGTDGEVSLLSYAPSTNSNGSSSATKTPISLIGDAEVSQLWQHKVQASAFLFSDTAFGALPNGTTLYAGQIIAPPTYWVGTAGKRYAINVVSQTGTTGTLNGGATTCTGTTGGVLTCNSATDLSVGQRFRIGTDTNKTITLIDATNPSAVLVYTGWLSQNYATATALSFSAPVLGLEVHTPTKSATIPTALAWSQGDTLQNSGATANGIAAWVNVAAGTPGTWAGIPLGNANGLLNLSQIFGTSSTSPVCPNGTGGTLTTVGCATGSSGVSSINSNTGAFTFSGAGVSCTGTTCTFTGGTGSGTVQSGTAYSPAYYPSGGGAVVAGVTPFTGLAWYTTSAAPAQANAAQIVGAIGSTAVTNATNAANLSNGAVGSLPYQSAAGATAFLASPTTSGHTFVPAWQPSGSALVPVVVDVNTLTVNAAATAGNFTTPVTGPVMGNGASAPSAATAVNLSAPVNCIAASGSGTAYTCSTSPTMNPGNGTRIQFNADVANTGSASLAVNGTSGSIRKWGAHHATLDANDLSAGEWISITYDGTYWQLDGQLGNANATQVNGAAPPASAALLGTNGSGQLVSATRSWSCQPGGIGDGLNAITAGTYLMAECRNTTGKTVTLTAPNCYSNNSGSSTLAVADYNSSGTLVGTVAAAFTCSTVWAAGTLGSQTTMAPGDYLQFTLVADGTTKTTSYDVEGTY